jgi:alanine--tRNA ligase
MEKLSLNTIREKYLSFFESKGHLRLPSFSLVPHNDASLLLINSGMAPLKPYFTGAEVPPRKRVTTCQKCIRTPDIENVGKTARHGTFFEMLGNFSFGDYFKREAISWAWEFFTKEMQIPAERLYVTVYQDDDEAFDIWTKEIGVPAERVIRMGKEDNFWEHGTGPCGPCSEIHYDRGEKYGCGKPGCSVGCDCDRYIEVWNLVFTQFDRQEDGTYEKLAHPNIDTGMGLERLACVMQDVDNLFEVDTVRKILDTVCTLSGKTYGADWKTDVSIRVITDHIRSTVMMIGDGVVPSNEARGYVLRRLLRGAARHGRLLGIKGNFLSKLADVVIELSGGAYPNLIEKQDYIKKVIRIEEERFASTIEQGMAMLSEHIKKMQESMGLNEGILPGFIAFKLHDTYGFPIDLTKDILKDYGFTVDEDGFRKEMNAQRTMAREALKNRESSWANSEITVPAECPETVFEGYEKQITEGEILYIIRPDGSSVSEAEVGDDIILVTDKTTFYAESGGQAGDKGTIETESGVVSINSVTKTNDGKWRHIGTVIHGSVSTGEKATMTVDRQGRLASERNHSATHLLQKALRMVLGEHVHQAGSSVTPERLRFDFNHMQAMTKEEIRAVENIVNDAIYNGYDVTTRILPIDEAKKLGAMALFGEKYGDTVRVVEMGDFSLEFCGGTHVKNTSSIGMFKILHESAVAAGVRRIEALTGAGARAAYMGEEAILTDITELFKANYSDVVNKVSNLYTQYKTAVKELERLKRENAVSDLDGMLASAIDINGVKVISGRFDALDPEGLRDLADKIRNKLDTGVVILASSFGGKAAVTAMATKKAVEKGIHCGNIVKKAAAVCGGGGGGRPDMAQAGGKQPEKIEEMLSKVEDFLF